MSDEKSLEDFFAKKDKSKKNKSKAKAKGKTKFTTTDEIAKNLVRDGEIRKAAAAKQDRESREKKEKEKKAAAAAAAAADAEQTATEPGEEKPNNKPAFPIGEAEEWNEFEDPSQKDYSGLKIQSLQISAEPEEAAEEDEEGELEMDENGDMVKRESGVSGPWNKSGGTTVQAATPTEPEPPAPKAIIKPEALKNVTGGKYVPPSRRNVSANESSTPSRMNRGGNKGSKNAPSIQSDLDFPSLAASSDIAKYSDKNDDKNYQEVRRGGQATDNPSGNKPGLALGNRYSALGN